jgi:hypothetical protein
MEAAMPAACAAAPAWADSETLSLVRPEVRALLEASEGFKALPPEEQRRLAGTMVKVASYMSNPDGVARELLPGGEGPLARAQDGFEATKDRLGQKQGFAGKDFEAGALKQGTQEFGNLVNKVDFPAFVGGLIQNVFQAIVNSSIQQMQAYGELLANVAKTVDQFARDNITENNARDWLADKFPDALGVETDPMAGSFAEDGVEPAPQPRLALHAEDEEAALRRISAELGLARPLTDISDEDQERQLVMAARVEMARSRQQLLASMVMMGINRIVVTDGLIHAKVVFSLQANDQARRRAKASMADAQRTQTSAGAAAAGWAPWGAAGGYANTSSDHSTTVESSVDEASESKAELKAKLTGEVRVNFKSDYLPMEKMATPAMISAIQGNATPRDRPGVGAAAPAAGEPAAQPAA